jgi:hypothetical protein
MHRLSSFFSDHYLYAFQVERPGGVASAYTVSVSATPMTYKTKSRRHFVVVATGSGPNAALAAVAIR